MPPCKLQLVCPICGSSQAVPQVGIPLEHSDVCCRHTCYWVITGFVAYDGQREMLKIYRHEVIRDLRWLSSASWDKTQEWKLAQIAAATRSKKERT